MRPILLSLRPAYADLVFNGLKRAELRRRIAFPMEGRDVFIYVSSPVCHLRGGFTVDKVWTGSPEAVWSQVSALAQVDRETFDSYYAGRPVAFALSIASVWEYKNQPSLVMLRKRFPAFVVPQSWRYLRLDEHRSFRHMHRVAQRMPGSRDRHVDVSRPSGVRNASELGAISGPICSSHRRSSTVRVTV